jgi:hypothetical protein
MMEKRQRKMAGIEATVSPPKLSGRPGAGVRHDVHTDGAGPSIRYSCNQWNRTLLRILKTGDQREVHVRFDEALNAEELIYFIM